MEKKMKKNLLLLLMAAFCSGLFCSEWTLTEGKYYERFYYTVTAAPQDYEATIGTTVCTWISRSTYNNLYIQPCQDKILEFLDAGRFEVQTVNGSYMIFLPVDFVDLSKSPLSKEQLTYIWNTMKNNYAGLSDMKKKGFSKKKLLAVSYAQELKDLLDKCMEDCHFYLVVGDLAYNQPAAYDEGTTTSTDPSGTYFEKETSNAYYVRFNECQSQAYLDNFEGVGQKALEKDYLILDARSNYGGNNYPQMLVRNFLNENKYDGTVVILQDNGSCSSGEVMEMFDKKLCNFEVLLVGTHSAGMQNYGNVQQYQDQVTGVFLNMGTTSFRKDLPSNYLGEGKGYEPDVWAPAVEMKKVLEGLGIDTADLEFK